MLPAAAMLSLLLLLSSLSVQAVSLQGQLRGSTALRLQEAEDRLASAAQLLVARIQLRHACLLPLALEQWAAAGCTGNADLAQLRQGEALGSPWQLNRWQPEATANALTPPQRRLMLEIALQPGGSEPALRAGFELRLTGPPWQVRELRPLGLRGEMP